MIESVENQFLMRQSGNDKSDEAMVVVARR